MAHLTTINADGSPQVTVVWIGLDSDDLLSGHMAWYAKPLNRLAKVYVSPDTEFPARRGPGYTVRYSIERIGGNGPWTAT